MRNGKIYLSIFVLISVIAGIVFSYQASSANQEIEKLSQGVAEGRVAGAITVKRLVSLSVDDGNSVKEFTVDVFKNTNVLEVLEKLKALGEIEFSTKQFDFGALLEDLNGMKNGEDNKYWLYYVNGEMPMVSIDNLLLKGGDKIELKFEKSNF